MTLSNEIETDSRSGRPPRLLCAATTAFTVDLLMRGQLSFMTEQGFETYVLSAPGRELDKVRRREKATVVTVPMAREIRPLSDVRSLFNIVRALLDIRPDLVNAGTPKAGLLCMVASRLVGVPVRIYMVRGLRSTTLDGWRRHVVRACELVASSCATDVLCVSSSLEREYRLEFPSASKKLSTLGHGSSNGIDLGRFRFDLATRRHLRRELAVSDGQPLIGFVGRIVKDKGIKEILDAFEQVKESLPSARLLVAGGYELGDGVDASVRQRLQGLKGVTHLGHVEDTSLLFPAIDLLVFPSFREGLGNVVLEAAACGVPAVGFDVTGTRDAIIHGQTGTLVPCGDVVALQEAIERYIKDSDLRVDHGRTARQMVAARYERSLVWSSLSGFYFTKLGYRTPAADLARSGSPRSPIRRDSLSTALRRTARQLSSGRRK